MIPNNQATAKTLWRKLPKNVQLSLFVVLGVGLWMFSGLFNNAPVETPHKALTPHVIAERMHAQTYMRAIRINGASEPLSVANLAAQTSGKVIQVKAEHGEQVTVGQSLLQIDLASRNTNLAAALANVAAEKTQSTAITRLFDEGFSSEIQLAKQKASLAEAQKQLADIQQDIAYTHVYAPITGLVEQRFVNIGDFVKIGNPLFTLVSRDEFLIVGHAAQQERDLIQQGQTAHATLANGQKVSGKVRFIATHANSATRTYRVELLIDGKAFQIPTGMTATLELPIGKVQAYLIPHSLLVLADDGTIGVMAVITKNDVSTATFIPTTALEDTPHGQWVEGIQSEHITLITRGHASISTGTIITYSKAEPLARTAPAPLPQTDKNTGK